MWAATGILSVRWPFSYSPALLPISGNVFRRKWMNTCWSALRVVHPYTNWSRTRSYSAPSVDVHCMSLRGDTLCERRSFGIQSENVRKFAEPAAVMRNISNAESWREVLHCLEKAMDVGHIDDLNPLLCTASDRFQELARNGKCPSTGAELCTLVTFWESTLLQPKFWRLRYPRGSAKMVHIACALAVELIKNEKFLTDDMAEFLDVFGKLVISHRSASLDDKGVPERFDVLQPFVDKIVEARDVLSRSSLLRGLVGCTRLKHMSVGPFLHVILEKCGDKQLESMADSELANLAEILSELKPASSVLRKTFDVFLARVLDFDLSLAVRMFCSWAAFYGTKALSSHEVFQVVERRLVDKIEQEPMSVDVACDVAIAFQFSNYQTRVLNLKDFLERNLHNMSPIVMNNLLLYVGGLKSVDNRFVQKVSNYTSGILQYLGPHDVGMMLSAMARPSLRKLHATTDFVSLLLTTLPNEQAPLLDCQPTLVLSIFCDLVTLGHYDYSHLQTLIDVVFAQIQRYDGKQVIRFLSLMCESGKMRDNIQLVRDSLAHVRVLDTPLSLSCACYLGKTLHFTRTSDVFLQQKVADCVLNVLIELTPFPLDYILLKRVSLCVFYLSVLRFPCPPLFDKLHSWIEDNVDLLLHHSGQHISMLLLFWAVVAQGVYPRNALLALHEWRPDEVRRLTILQLTNLTTLVLSASDQLGMTVLSRETLAAVCERITAYQPSEKNYFKNTELLLRALLPSVQLRKDFLTGDLFQVDFAFLKWHDGSLSDWPVDFPLHPSKNNMQQLRRLGVTPVVIKHFGRCMYLNSSSALDGQSYFWCRCVESLGWQVLDLNSGLICGPFSSEYLRSKLRNIGVSLSNSYTPRCWKLPSRGNDASRLSLPGRNVLPALRP